MKNKVAVVTGASGVLCSVFCRALSKEGYHLALLGLDEKSLSALADEINGGGGKAAYYVANVLDREVLEKTHTEILNELGKCSLLINGAGGNSPKATTTHEFFEANLDEGEVSFFGLPKEGFSFVFDLNILGTVLPCQVFMPDMIGEEGCSVINISSMNAFTPLTKIPAYSGAKSAVSNFTQWLAVHFAKENIRVNAIAPGFFVTAQNEALLFDKDGTPTPRTNKILNATPMGRFGEADELTGTLLWLCDPAKSGFVTGVVIPVDGGFSAYSGV